MSTLRIKDEDGNLLDGLYQWDVGIKIEISGITLNDTNARVHFVSKEDNEALVVVPTIQQDKTKLTVTIPTKLLQKTDPIMAYIYDRVGSNGGRKTKYFIRIPIEPRMKPAGYNYVETADVVYEHIEELTQLAELIRTGMASSIDTSGNIHADGDITTDGNFSAKGLIETEGDITADGYIEADLDLIAGKDVKAYGNIYQWIDDEWKQIATQEYVDNKTQPATASSLGVVKVGDGLSVENDGTMKVSSDIRDKAGLVTKDGSDAKFSGDVYANTNKKLATEEYVNNHTPNAATKDSLGTVKVGGGLNVANDGAVSVNTNEIATRSYADGKASAAEENAKADAHSYTDTEVAKRASKSAYGTMKVGDGLSVGSGANEGMVSVDTNTIATKTYADTKAGAAEAAAKNYADTKASVAEAAAKSYADTQASAAEAAAKGYVDDILADYGCYLEYDSEHNELLLMNADGDQLGEGIEIIASGGGGGLAFDRGIVLVDSTNNKNYLHLQKENEQTGEYEDVIDPIELPATASGVGDSAHVNFSNTMLATQLGSPAKKFTAVMGRETLITYYWDCTDASGAATVGNATVQWYVDNILVSTEDNVIQGNNSFDISSYLHNGRNDVTIVVTSDVYDITPASFTWYVNATVYSISIDKTAIGYYGAGFATIRITTTGSSSNGVVKTLYVAIDGTDNEHIFSTKVSPSSTESVTIPAQTHGVHTIYVWMSVSINGVTVSTDVVQHKGIWIVNGNNTVIIATEKDSYEAQAYSHTPVKWMAINPSGDSATITRYIDGSPFGGEIVAANGVTQEWMYTPTQSCTLKIASGIVYKEISFTVVAPPEGKRPYTEGMVMSVDPSGHNNNESTRTQFGYTDKNGSNHPFTFSSNFDWVNGGFQTGSDSDDNGIPAFVVKRGTWIEFDRSLFLATDNTNGEDYSNQGIGSGKHISIIFKSKNVTDYDAEIARCYSGMGMNLYAQKALFRAGETMYCLYGEDRIIELSLNINPSVGSYGTMKWWLSGTPAEGRIFTKTTDSGGTVNVGTSFSQASPQNFRIGSDECDVWIYRFRMFNTVLTNAQVLRNYIADCGNADLINKRYERNDIYDSGTGKIDIDKLKKAAPNLHIITIEASAFPQAKGGDGKTSCTIRHQIGNGVSSDQWVATNAKYTLQGTSSMSYRVSAGNIDIDMKNATMSVIGTNETLNGYSMTPDSIPVKYFNLKANVASSDNANNVCIAQLFNTYNPLVSKAKSIDGRVRDTVEGHPCVVFLKNTGESTLLAGVPGSRTIAPGDTIMYFAGDMNNSKKNTNVFGQTSEWDDETHKQCCVEFANNDKIRCVFKAHNFDAEQWDPGNTDTEIANNSHFEFRYPDGEGTEDMKNAFVSMHEWVWSTDCDPDETYGKPFSEDYVSSITYNGILYGSTESEHKAYRLAKFKNELPNYFNVTNLLYYYLFTEFFLMVDNRSKNMFMSYEPDENNIWRWNVSKNYDDDTALGIDNKGGFSWEDPYTIEDTTRYGDNQTPCFNAANSVLWVNLRKCFKTELINMFNALESAEGSQAVGGARLFDPDAVANMFDSYQRIRPETLMVDDHYAKYDQPIINANDTSYLTGMGHGEKIEQRRQFLKYRSKYISSKYVSASAKNDRIIYQATNHSAFYPELQITPYSTMYIGLTIDEAPSDPVLVRKGETATLRYLDGNGRLLSVGGEQNLGIVNGSNITHIDGAGRLFPRRITYTLGKLQDILLGSDIYTNSNTFTVPFSAVPLAKKIDLRGLAGVNGEINLSKHDLLEELYLDRAGQGDGITLILPKSERITKLSLGGNVTDLTAIDIPNLTASNFSCNSANMTSCRIENVPAIDTKELLNTAVGLRQGRVTNVSWQLDNPDLLLRLGGLDPDKIYEVDWNNTEDALAASRYTGAPKGFTASGGELDHFYLSGNIIVAKSTAVERTAIEAAFASFGAPTITWQSAPVQAHTVTFINYDDTELCKQIVRHGDSAVSPINNVIPTRRISVPVKPSDKLTVYTFSNWARWDGANVIDGSMSNITNDVTFKAMFDSSPRMCNVKFCHHDGSVIEEYNVAAGGTATYSGRDLSPISDGGFNASDNAVWIGFRLKTPEGSEYDEFGDKLSTQVVYSDIIATAWYIKPSSLSDMNITRPAPSVEYVYSDDPEDKGGWSLEEFYTVLCNCTYAKSKLENGQKLKLGDKVKIVLDSNNLLTENDRTIVMVVVGFECYKLSDGSGYAKVAFHMKGVTSSAFAMIGVNDSTNYMAGWGDTSSRFSPTLRGRLNDGYMNGSIYVPSIFSVLPLHWRNMIKEVSIKYTIARTAAGLAPSIGVSNDKLFLPSIYEMGYSTTNTQSESAYAPELDSSDGQTLEYYTTNTSRVKGAFNKNGEDIENDLYMQRFPYHLRTQAWDNHVGFWRVEESGGINLVSYSYRYNAHRVAFAFCI